MSTAFNVWQPQGNVVANPGGNKLGNPSVIPGLTGIVLSGTVFGMWAGYGGAGTVYYFESYDGLTNWTPYAGNPLTLGSTYIVPTVYYEAGTFYMYVSPGGTDIVVLTSTDRTTWTSQGSQISVGSAGAWDSSGVFQLNIVTQLSGTWYAYYSGTNGSVYGQGLATSTDLIHWTKSPLNPIFPGPIGNMSFLTVGSTYYAYAPFPNPNATLKTNQNNPMGRWSAPTPSGPWVQLQYNSQPVPVYYVATPAELNGSGGLPATNANDPRIVSANGNMYLYYTLTATGGAEQAVYAALASGYTPAQLVATYEGVFNVPFATMPSLNFNTLASDNFQRANQNPLAGNWTTQVAGNNLQLSSDAVTSATAGTIGLAYYNAISFPNDQWATAAALTSSASSVFGPQVRMGNSGVRTAYSVPWIGTFGSPGPAYVQQEVSGTYTQLDIFNLTLNSGDSLTACAIGSNIYTYWDGFLVRATSASALSSGIAGLIGNAITSTANLAITSWSGGGFQNAPNPPSSGGSGSLAMMGCGQ